MKTLFIFEKENEDIKALKEGFNKRGISVELVEIGNLGLLTEGKQTFLKTNGFNLEEFDSCFLEAGIEFTRFIEPLLDEFSQKGIYCQVKPDAYSILSNKAFLFTTLNANGIKTPETTVFGSSFFINSSLKEFSFPLVLQVFQGYKKIQNVLVESEKALLSIVKSIKSDFDVILLQEFFEKDLDESAVIGENVFTVRRTWNKDKLEYSKKGSSITLSEGQQNNLIKACESVGIEISTIKSIDGKVVSLKPFVDFSYFQGIIGKNLYDTTAEFYLSKFRKE
jgi:glutathione synthase/RimK-type ligase-like ATP-grasp enzyme